MDSIGRSQGVAATTFSVYSLASERAVHYYRISSCEISNSPPQQHETHSKVHLSKVPELQGSRVPRLRSCKVRFKGSKFPELQGFKVPGFQNFRVLRF